MRTFFCLYWLAPHRYRLPLLLAASYFFYGYWSVKFLGLLIFTMGVDYILAIAIADASSATSKKRFLVLSLVLNLGILFLFKYFNLFAELAASLTQRPLVSLDWILPFGISFYTFHAMSYVIDVYRGVLPAERNFTNYSAYVMFFPQLVAGPIARASHLLHQFQEPKSLRRDKFIDGAYLILKGFFLKLVFADALGATVDGIFGPEMATSNYLKLQAVYAFAFQIYLDFFGYTLIARGLAKWLDYELVENFNRPYIATSITDFWHRWHISLSTWLRDYLYISLGGNRKGRLRTYANLMITMLLGGLWHGASWTFMAWGGLHGLFLAFERLVQKTPVEKAWNFLPKPVRQVWIFHCVCLGWIFFRADNFDQALVFLKACAACFTHPLANWSMAETLWRNVGLIGLVLVYEALEVRVSIPRRFAEAPGYIRYAVAYASIAAIALGSVLNPSAFIYFQF